MYYGIFTHLALFAFYRIKLWFTTSSWMPILEIFYPTEGFPVYPLSGSKLITITRLKKLFSIRKSNDTKVYEEYGGGGRKCDFVRKKGFSKKSQL